MKDNKRDNIFLAGDIIAWYESRGDQKVIVFGTIIYRYCETDKMKEFLDKHKTVVYDKDSTELKKFYINEVMQLDNNKMWELDDRYIFMVSYAKSAKA